MIDVVLVFLRSNRARTLIVAFALAALKKVAPDAMPDEATMNWLYGSLVAFIAGDTVRPIDPDKQRK